MEMLLCKRNLEIHCLFHCIFIIIVVFFSYMVLVMSIRLRVILCFCVFVQYFYKFQLFLFWRFIKIVWIENENHGYCCKIVFKYLFMFNNSFKNLNKCIFQLYKIVHCHLPLPFCHRHLEISEMDDGRNSEWYHYVKMKQSKVSVEHVHIKI